MSGRNESMLRAGVGLIAVLGLTVGLSGLGQAGGFYAWGSTQFDCEDSNLVCQAWHAADPDAPGEGDSLLPGLNVASYNTGDAELGCNEQVDGTVICAHRYETATAGDHHVLAIRNADWSADGTFNAGGVIFDGGLADKHASNGGTVDLDLPVGVWEVDVTIVDDSGKEVGGFFCSDSDGNGLCAENTSEEAQALCNSSPIFGTVDTSEFHSAIVFIDGPNFQTMDCPGTTNLEGGSSGIVELKLTPVS